MNRAAIAAMLLGLASPALAQDAPADPKPADPPAPETKPTEPPPSIVTTPAEPPPKYQRVVVTPTTLQRHGQTIDLTLAGGVTLARSGDDTQHWFGRARVSWLAYNEPNFLIVGLAGQFSPLGSKSLGVEAQYIDLWRGTWIQGGVYPLDTTHGVSIEGSVGYALFGVEYQRRLSGDHSGDQALVLSLHVPLGVVRAAIRPPPGVILLPPATAGR